MVAHELAHFPLFQDLDVEILQIIAPWVTRCEYPQGQVVFEQGSRAGFFYIVISGEVEISFKPYDGPPMSVARVVPGGVFGWSAALGHDAYTSSATCLSACRLYRLDGGSLHNLCKDYPGAGDVIMERLAGVIADRLRRGHTGICNILTQEAAVDKQLSGG